MPCACLLNGTAAGSARALFQILTHLGLGELQRRRDAGDNAGAERDHQVKPSAHASMRFRRTEGARRSLVAPAPAPPDASNRPSMPPTTAIKRFRSVTAG